MKNLSNTTRDSNKNPVPKIDKYIEVVGSGNPRLNAMAEDSQLTILSTLRTRYTHVEITLVNDISDLEKLVAKKPDLVVLGMKLILLDPSKSYDDSPKVWLPSYFEEHGINFTGSDTNALLLEFDKPVAKQTVLDANLETSRYFISTINQPIFEHTLRFPLFVKPTNRADSLGVDEKSVVHSDEELEAKVRSIHLELSSDALIEEYLPGREFSVAVIREAGTEELLAMPIELVPPADVKGNSFLSHAVKQADAEQVVAIDNAELKINLNALAIGVFKALGSRDYGRIDMRLDSRGAPSFIEANLIPGLSDHGYLSSCFYINNHISYEDMILQIISLAFERSQELPVGVVSTILRSNAPTAPELMLLTTS